MVEPKSSASRLQGMRSQRSFHGACLKIPCMNMPCKPGGGGGRVHWAASKSLSKQTTKRKDNPVYVDLQECITLFNYLIDNTFLQFGEEAFQQIIGIPVGTNFCSVFIANLFL